MTLILSLILTPTLTLTLALTLTLPLTQAAVCESSQSSICRLLVELQT